MFEALAGGHYLAVVAAAAGGLAVAATFRLVRARQRVAQMTTALDNMSQGLCMFDAGRRLVLCNRSYLKMYDLSPDVVKPGCTLRQLLQYRIKRGAFTSEPEQYIPNLMAVLAKILQLELRAERHLGGVGVGGLVGRFGAGLVLG